MEDLTSGNFAEFSCVQPPIECNIEFAQSGTAVQQLEDTHAIGVDAARDRLAVEQECTRSFAPDGHRSPYLQPVSQR